MLSRKDKETAKKDIDEALSNLTVCALTLEEEKAQGSELDTQIKGLQEFFGRIVKLVDDTNKEGVSSIVKSIKQYLEAPFQDQGFKKEEIEAKGTQRVNDFFSFPVYNQQTYELAKSLTVALEFLKKMSDSAFVKFVLAFSPKTASARLQMLKDQLPKLATSIGNYETAQRYSNQNSNVANPAHLYQAANNNGSSALGNAQHNNQAKKLVQN